MFSKMGLPRNLRRGYILYVLLASLSVTIRGSEHVECHGDSCTPLVARDPFPMEPEDTEMPDAPYDGGQSYDGGQQATSDRSAGIGMEFECAWIQFHSEQAKNDLDEDKTFQSKGKVVAGKTGTNWKFTADDLKRKGDLDLEIQLDGKNCKVGTDALWQAMDAATKELVRWDPSRESIPRGVTIQGSPFNDWIIMDPEHRRGITSPDSLWAPQVTVPMPLEAIQWIIEYPRPADDEHVKLYRPSRNQVKVMAAFFKKSPGGVSTVDVQYRPDVLGFLSVVLTFAKIARPLPKNESPKGFSSIMPRNDFTTIYKTQGIDRVLPPNKLYEIVKGLACFKNSGNDVATGGTNYEKDNDFNSGSFDDPTPTDKMDGLAFKIGEGEELKVKKWIESIADGTVPDALSKLDESVDKSIGGFKTDLENVKDTTRAVPVWEFRKLDNIPLDGTVKFAKRVGENVDAIHRRSKNSPASTKKRSVEMLSLLESRDEDADCGCPDICTLWEEAPDL